MRNKSTDQLFDNAKKDTLNKLKRGIKDMKYILSLIVIIIHSSCDTGYKRYVPVYISENDDRSRFVERPDSLTPQHIEGIKKVFTHYRVPFRMDGKSIYYKGTIEQELLWNYSIKASDKQWLDAHN